jgi:pyruvate dehydrogenase phosphatase
MESRAFGDALWKWPLEFQRDVQKRFYGPSPLTPRCPVQTPPYLTAEPVATSTKIDTDSPSFLIMATDGLWDTLSNQQAVDLVGTWLERGRVEQRNGHMEPAHEPFGFGQFGKGVSWKFVGERTTVQDENVAVHLVRNSLGGNHHELVAGRLAFEPPSSRRARDDTTVQVVFFNVPETKR